MKRHLLLCNLMALVLTTGAYAGSFPSPIAAPIALRSLAPDTDIYHAPRTQHLSDSALLDLVEHQTFRYFWDYAHPVSGLARERSNQSYDYGDEVVTIGGSGFGIMAIIVATERKWIPRDSAVARMNKIVRFLWKADSYHGIFPHWMNGATGKTIPFSRKDDGADLERLLTFSRGCFAPVSILTGTIPVSRPSVTASTGCGIRRSGTGIPGMEGMCCIGIGVLTMDGPWILN